MSDRDAVRVTVELLVRDDYLGRTGGARQAEMILDADFLGMCGRHALVHPVERGRRAETLKPECRCCAARGHAASGSSIRRFPAAKVAPRSREDIYCATETTDTRAGRDRVRVARPEERRGRSNGPLAARPSSLPTRRWVEREPVVGAHLGIETWEAGAGRADPERHRKMWERVAISRPTAPAGGSTASLVCFTSTKVITVDQADGAGAARTGGQ
jgi:hypothetical protein